MATAPLWIPQDHRYPSLNAEFELELDANIPANRPYPGMIIAFGYDPKDWGFAGTPLIGKSRRKFKLVRVGFQSNLLTVRRALEVKHGSIPPGQWIKAFIDAYPRTDGSGPVGVADPSWIHPDGNSDFPFLDSAGKPRFNWTISTLHGHWRWLVFAEPESAES